MIRMMRKTVATMLIFGMTENIVLSSKIRMTPGTMSTLQKKLIAIATKNGLPQKKERKA